MELGQCESSSMTIKEQGLLHIMRCVHFAYKIMKLKIMTCVLMMHVHLNSNDANNALSYNAISFVLRKWLLSQGHV